MTGLGRRDAGCVHLEPNHVQKSSFGVSPGSAPIAPFVVTACSKRTCMQVSRWGDITTDGASSLKATREKEFDVRTVTGMPFGNVYPEGTQRTEPQNK